MESKLSNTIGWIAQVAAALIMLQTLFFKFTAAPEAVYIFTTMGAEPYGRIITGVLELIASFLLLFRRTAWTGAFLSTSIMLGAIFSHLTVLGIEVMGDRGLLFSLAIITFFCSLLVLLIRRRPLRKIMSEL